VSGIGLLTATAIVASAGSAHAFRNGRHLAPWLGLTPREYSSGRTRRRGRISKRGDVYLRMLLIQGARAVLNRAKQLAKAGHALTQLQRWARAGSPRRIQQSHRGSCQQAGAHRLGLLEIRAGLQRRLPTHCVNDEAQLQRLRQEKTIAHGTAGRTATGRIYDCNRSSNALIKCYSA